ncbi:protein disulfide oxidoreductase [Methylogaea oryzae]|uniref:protein disulfide oxidoreductase n=1 Tax=Methylogaea oryzae TaxID=1295382 RepID=UPI0020D1B399|nr:protein disulfide oxidoreductase [Methylogaea oryzae]
MILAAALAVQAYRGRDVAQGLAPPLSGAIVSGRFFDLAQLRGKPALVYFWATWCGVCKAMQHNIDALAGDVPLITVALQSGDAVAVGRFLQERGIVQPVLLDEDGEAAARYGIRGVPAAFVLGPDGAIRYVALGYSSEWGLRLRLWLAER